MYGCVHECSYQQRALFTLLPSTFEAVSIDSASTSQPLAQKLVELLQDIVADVEKEYSKAFSSDDESAWTWTEMMDEEKVANYVQAYSVNQHDYVCSF